MKKIYEMPVTEVMKIATHTILAGSPGKPNAAVDSIEDSIDPNEIESRRHNNVWDDEEEENY